VVSNGKAKRSGEERPLGTVETFDHTADVGLRVRGSDLDDLFRTAAEGVFDYIVVNRAEVRAVEPESLALTADSPDELLAVWLNELIFRCETKHRLYSQFDPHVSDDGQKLQAEIRGEPIDRGRHVLDHEVKAVTRHGLSLHREGSEWVAELILDI
jgi:SHS2 domain-containing protein